MKPLDPSAPSENSPTESLADTVLSGAYWMGAAAVLQAIYSADRNFRGAGSSACSGRVRQSRHRGHFRRPSHGLGGSWYRPIACTTTRAYRTSYPRGFFDLLGGRFFTASALAMSDAILATIGEEHNSARSRARGLDFTIKKSVDLYEQAVFGTTV